MQALARMRMVRTSSIAAGGLPVGFAVWVDAPWAYRAVMASSGLLFLLAALFCTRMPDRALNGHRTPASVASVLANRPYIALIAVYGALTLSTIVLGVGLPLWVVGHSAAPSWIVGAFKFLNTLCVIAWQARANRGTDRLERALGRLRTGGVFAAISSAAVLAMGSNGVFGDIAIVLIVVAMFSMGEVFPGSRRSGCGARAYSPGAAADLHGRLQRGVRRRDGHRAVDGDGDRRGPRVGLERARRSASERQSINGTSVVTEDNNFYPAHADIVHARMREALALATEAVGLSDPNPRVGCVLTDASSRVIGRGHTQQAGGAHAEVMALRDAAAGGESVVGATAYVTLEPCSHCGRTPPCCNALIDAGLRRVVVALRDANPVVAGFGLARLREAGIDVVELPDGALRDEAQRLNVGFLFRMRHGRPWVRMKLAASLDGKTAMPDGDSKWITAEAARRDGHAWRRRAGAILTGVGTVLADDPELDARLFPTARQPLRIVVDSMLRTPVGARLLNAGEPVRIYYASARMNDGRKETLESRRADLRHLPNTAGGLDLQALIGELGQEGINELHVEAGGNLNGALIRAGLVDKLLIYVAPRLIGAGRDLAALASAGTVGKSPVFRFIQTDQVGQDVRLLAVRAEKSN
ncbi:bifunctional diaminohydroxyphosphoribosylaminopyrimidine deaminase/5-amino-6-(5-phosphoribosylamino)uracil reductase RibD [Burkholderia ubonensis]|uniref:bifunctional diaminohydroxyphosphoribosylaminopyrimidine deaminase/5-amino-6-(5-phosphoribosylamino)uracil reductase RibD n=1 Tax=Burkholderia ubonensis TaxID=101571 RepID=UPI002FC9FF90